MPHFSKDSTSSHDSINVRIPGKIMLCGEYAVLKGHYALSSSLDVFFEIEISSHSSNLVLKSDEIELKTPIWSSPKTFTRKDLESSRFPKDDIFISVVSEGLRLFSITAPLTINIKSCFPISYGIGSSSALRLGVLFSLESLFNKTSKNPSPHSLCNVRWNAARSSFLHQKAEQENASGYDIVTQIFGGLVSFKHDEKTNPSWPGYAERHGSLSNHPLEKFIHPFVCNKGAPTKSTVKDGIQYLDKSHLWDDLEHLHNSLYSLLLACYNSNRSISIEDQKNTFLLVEEHRKLFRNAISFPITLDDILSKTKDFGHSWHYKTSGAGGEDAIIIFGYKEHLTNVESTLNNLGWSKMPYKFGSRGLHQSS